MLIAEHPPHSPIRASGSYLGCLTAKPDRPAVRGPAPGSREPGSASGACFADPRSPWSPPFAPSPPPPDSRFCSATSQLLWRSQASPDRPSAATAPHLPAADHPPLRACGRCGDLPVPVQGACVQCQVLRPRRVTQALAMTRLGMLPSATQTASALGISFLSRLNG